MGSSGSGVSIMAAFARSYNKFLQTARAVPQLRQMSGDAHAGGYKMWKNLTFFVAFPVIVLGNINAFVLLTRVGTLPRPSSRTIISASGARNSRGEMGTILLSTTLTQTPCLTDTNTRSRDCVY